MDRQRLTLTTAIPYVNGPPHLGHALELVQTDVLARHRRLRGQQVRFQTGTDDNAFKNVAAARAAGQPIREFVDAHGDGFAALRDTLTLSYDDFIRTSSDPRRAPGVQRLWRQCAANGDFYQHRYEGLYCNGCEQFYAPGDVAESRCPEHAAPLHRVVEQNWFFRLSTYADELHRVIAEGEVAVVPATKRNEVLAFIKSGLADFSVSRPAGRSGGWGIGVPDDPSQVVYVWWDALTNYVTALGYGTDDGSAYRDWWVDADERVHVIGKGILRFHAVYWLALLLSAKQPLPTSIFVHDYVSVDGEKLAKSAAGAVGPADVVAAYGVDALRWWFVREVPVVGDVDFTVERLVGCANTDLANGLGNLVQRTLTLVRTYSGGQLQLLGNPGPPVNGRPVVAGSPAYPPALPAADLLTAAVTALPNQIDAALGRFDLRSASTALCAVVDAGNKYVEQTRPWEIARRAASADAGGTSELDAVLATLVHACRSIVHELTPFLPTAAAELRHQLGQGSRVGAPTPVFPRLGATTEPPLG